MSYKDITNFEQALNAWYKGKEDINCLFKAVSSKEYGSIIDFAKLYVIKNALNQDLEESGTSYYPWVYLITDDSLEGINLMEDSFIVGKIQIKDKIYQVVGTIISDKDSPINITFVDSDVITQIVDTNYICCKSKDIAKHYAKYFSGSIMDAMYGSNSKVKIL